VFVDVFLDAHAVRSQITLDLDATDDPLHGTRRALLSRLLRQLLHLPPRILGRHLLASKLPSGQHRWQRPGSVEEVARIIARIRQRWPRGCASLLRADSGFAREALMGVVEANAGDFCSAARTPGWLGESKRARRRGELGQQTGQADPPLPGLHLADARTAGAATSHRRQRPNGSPDNAGDGRGQPRARRHLASARRRRLGHLYEKLYCARGRMETASRKPA